MEIQYVYVRTRAQFGKQCIFEDSGPTVNQNIAPNPELMGDYIHKDPCHVGIQESKQYALHEMQTSSTITKESGMFHAEGGWPKEINPKDEEVTARFRRRVEKDDNWPPRMRALLTPMEQYVLQNNAINIYENFFDDMIPTELVLPLEARTVNVYTDPQQNVRPITHLSWSPDQGKRLAVSYCCMEFQNTPPDLSPYSYIWDIENPTKAFMALKSFCPSAMIEFNPRDPSMLISGLMSGQVCNWDIRTGNKPVQLSHLQFSHRNPANQALWINSKTNSEFFSASSDGLIKWWDIRKLREPTETLTMDLDNPMRADVIRAVGVSALQFEPTMGTKFMSGMENGVLVSGTRKGKNPLEKLALRFNCHYGPIVAIDRNPFSVKQFLTVGDWTTRIWAEDTKESNLISTGSHACPLTGGCWSTSRYSVFYIINMDGLLQVYDLLIRVDQPVRTIRLCEDGLRAIKPHEEGKLVAAGSVKGNVYLVECSEALTINAKNDKVLLINYLERCSRFEKAIDNRLKEGRVAQKAADESATELVSRNKTDGQNKGDKRKDRAAREEKEGKGKADEKEKKKVKSKRTKDGKTLAEDPELAEAEAQYYGVVQKEIEKYASAKDTGAEGTAMAAELPGRRKRHEERGDKDGGKKADKKEGGKGGRGKDRKRISAEEIVIVKKRTKTSGSLEEKAGKLEEEEEEAAEEARIKAGTEDDSDEEREKMRKDRKTGKADWKGKKRHHFHRARYQPVRVDKPCGLTVCKPAICCKSTKGIRSYGSYKLGELRKTGKPLRASSKVREGRLEQPILSESEYPVPPRRKRILLKKDEPPSVLYKEAKVARRQLKEEAERIRARKWRIAMRMRRRVYGDSEDETRVRSESTFKASTSTKRPEKSVERQVPSKLEKIAREEFQSVRGKKLDPTRCEEPEGIRRISVGEVLKRTGVLELRGLKGVNEEPKKVKKVRDPSERVSSRITESSRSGAKK